MRSLSNLAWIASLALLYPCNGDFMYGDFNETAGLTFLGSATTSSCGDNGPYDYQVNHGINDEPDRGEQPVIQSETISQTLEEFYATSASKAVLESISKYSAVVPHRDNAISDPMVGCPVRLRLTPARASKIGSVQRIEAEPVLSGFETGFSFQITDHSQKCVTVKDRSFSTLSHKSCWTHGGDGFAFVIHNDRNGTRAIGLSGKGIGYEGIRNAVVLEVDTWFNPEKDTGDSIYDHISLQASPAGDSAVGVAAANAANTKLAGEPPGSELFFTVEDMTIVQSSTASRLSPIKKVSAGDGQIHRVKLQYFNFLRYDLLPYFSGSTFLVQFLKDGGENRRVGTLVVYYDDMNEPILAVPINLNNVLKLPEDQAFMGFTAATGRAWEKHDIIDWYFCRYAGCPELTGNKTYLKYSSTSVPAFQLPDDFIDFGNEPETVPP